MYEVFEKLMKSKNINASKVSADTGIAQYTLSDWKNGKSTPKTDKLEILAKYFGVTVEYLRTGKESTLPVFEPEYVEVIEMYSKLTKEQKDAFVSLLRSIVK